MKATEQLIKEHEEISLMTQILISVINNLEKGTKVNPLHLEAILDFLKNFVDKCHHAKEEKLLFPALVHKGVRDEDGPIGIMLTDHEHSKKAIGALSDAITAYRLGSTVSSQEIIINANSYMELLHRHLAHEKNILFKMADNKLSEGEQELLVREFDKLENTEIGSKKHEQYQKMLTELKDIYL
jgi:hemerythrin-like domain-containing protein